VSGSPLEAHPIEKPGLKINEGLGCVLRSHTSLTLTIRLREVSAIDTLKNDGSLRLPVSTVKKDGCL
jgi:hypothetical protein